MLSIVLVKAILERLRLVVGVHRILRNVEVSEGHAQGASYGEHADVVARKLNGLASADQRALLSSPSSARSSCNGATAGGVGGGADEVGTGGVSQPFRTASASTGLLVAYGGPSSATIRSRSVIRTVSPDAATRTYSLSLLFRTFMPTDLMKRTVTPRCYLVKVVTRRSHDRAGRTDTARRNHRKPGRDRVGARRAAAGRLETLAGGVLWDEIFSIIWSRAIWTREVLVHASVRRGRVCRPSAREFRARSEPVEAVRAGARRSPGAAGRSGRSAPAPGPRSHRGPVRGRGRRA